MCVNKLADGAAIGRLDYWSNYKAIWLLGILIPIDPVFALSKEVVSNLVDFRTIVKGPGHKWFAKMSTIGGLSV